MTEIIKHTGDITAVTEGIIIHQVNAQGVMGSGVAKALRDKWPQVFTDYTEALGAPYTQNASGLYLLGRVIVTNISPRLLVCSLVGQQFFGRDADRRYTSYDALDLGFKEINKLANKEHLPAHIPLIGSGLGGGDWNIVSAIITSNISKQDVHLWELG